MLTRTVLKAVKSTVKVIRHLSLCLFVALQHDNKETIGNFRAEGDMVEIFSYFLRHNIYIHKIHLGIGALDCCQYTNIFVFILFISCWLLKEIPAYSQCLT